MSTSSNGFNDFIGRLCGAASRFRPAGRGRSLLVAVVITALLVYAVWLSYKWTVMRVFVPHDKALLVINKFGKALPADRVVVPREDDGFKGVQEEVRGPGRYFLDPIQHDWQLVNLEQIPAGDPSAWKWNADGYLVNPKAAPMVGIVSMKEGKTPPPGLPVVDPGYKGIQREVLTPGTYRVNPAQREVKQVPAVVVPPGSVGVVTRLIGDVGEVTSATLTEIRASTTGPATQAATQPALAAAEAARQAPSRLVSGPTQRGILRDVLQPGIYYLNPYAVKVSIVPIGYDEITLEHPTNMIRFYSRDGYLVEADFTVVWGRSPADAPHIVANIGLDKDHGIDRVRNNVIEPAMKAACQNEGAKYGAKELIQGATRTEFQLALTQSLEAQVASRNIHVLLALVRNISIKDNSGRDATDGLLTTIQRANIEKERDLTNQQKTETAAKKAELEQALKLVDVARETVSSETGVKVANIRADAEKRAAEIDAARELEVSSIELEISKLESQRTQILGKARADVERLRNEAEARGAKLLVDAFGTPQAYNQYIFAKNFQPKDLRFIFAGPGTFWTDLKSFQDIGASKVLQQSQEPPRVPERATNAPVR